jgi:uncharacterized protein with HEPN domain
MPPKLIKLLNDIEDAASFIVEATDGKSLDEYRSDRLLRQAVERNFEIIGEAVLRLARDDAETAAALGPFQQIISFRNVLIHGYDLIDDAQVWQVVNSDLPQLVGRVRELLQHADED